MATIGFVLPGWPGHDNPALRLARVLEEAGHRTVTWRSRDLGRHVPVMPPGAQSGGRTPERLHETAAWRLAAAVELTGPLIERLNQAAIDLVVYDSMSPWGSLAAQWLGLPRVASLTGVPQSMPASLPPPPPPVAEQFQADRTRLFDTWGIDPTPRQILGFFGDLTYLYTTREVSGIGLDIASWRFVGPLSTGSPGASRARTRPSPRPLVYVSLGTSFNRDVEVHRAILAGLAGVDADVLLSTGRGVSEDELRPVPAHVEVVPWADPAAVLATARVLVTHGGATSVHEALVAGVPMLVLPQAADQHHWAARVETLGVGEALTEPDVGAIRASVERLLDDPQPRRRAAEIGIELVAGDGAQVALAGIEGLLATG